jgi:hypothetical protein
MGTAPGLVQHNTGHAIEPRAGTLVPTLASITAEHWRDRVAARFPTSFGG